MVTSVPKPIKKDASEKVLIFSIKPMIFSINSTPSLLNPQKSLIWPTNNVIPIPVVKPTIIGKGINFTSEPSLNTPSKISKIPAIMVAICNPIIPISGSLK